MDWQIVGMCVVLGAVLGLIEYGICSIFSKRSSFRILLSLILLIIVIFAIWAVKAYCEAPNKLGIFVIMTMSNLPFIVIFGLFLGWQIYNIRHYD